MRLAVSVLGGKYVLYSSFSHGTYIQDITN